MTVQIQHSVHIVNASDTIATDQTLKA